MQTDLRTKIDEDGEVYINLHDFTYFLDDYVETMQTNEALADRLSEPVRKATPIILRGLKHFLSISLFGHR